ncbi:hypothetical protein D9M71_695880 [compost metagenome]
MPTRRPFGFSMLVQAGDAVGAGERLGRHGREGLDQAGGRHRDTVARDQHCIFLAVDVRLVQCLDLLGGEVFEFSFIVRQSPDLPECESPVTCGRHDGGWERQM